MDHYDWSGGREVMLRFGPGNGPVVMVALPLFEEANRVRAFAVAICRALAERGVASVLPDLPGQGESAVPTEAMTLTDLRSAFAQAARSIDGAVFSVALRSGAIIESEADVAGRWRLSPQTGQKLLSDLQRASVEADWAAGKKAALATFGPDSPPITLAGNRVGFRVFNDLREAETSFAGSRIVRLETDPLPADRKFDAAPLWRRAEPDNDPTLAALLADDIADWIAACEG